jgi:hypothetical protein
MQLSPASQVDYNLSIGHSLPPLTPLHDSFDMSGRPHIGNLYESKTESENSWEQRFQQSVLLLLVAR